MATINPSQDYDIIYTLTYASSGGTDPIRLHRGSSQAGSGTVYYRAGTSGAWTSLSVSGINTTYFPITSTTMQIAHNWNKSNNDYTTASFLGGTMTGIAISQKAALSGVMGAYFMYYYAKNCPNLTALEVPDTSGLTSTGSYFMFHYARNCPNLTTLEVPDTSGLTSVGDWFMSSYAYDCSSLTILAAPDTSGLTSVGSRFMYWYAPNCSSLTSLEIPDTSGLTSAGSSFMYQYAHNCSSLTQLILPKAGWFKTNNVDWSVPSARLGNLKGSCIASDYVDDWKGLITSGNTLHTNYIRDVGRVDNILEIDYDTTLNYGSGTYEDVAIRLGANTASGVTLGLGGSPTFRSLIIQSKNSAAHTVRFDDGAWIEVDKLVAVGSSSQSKLTLVGSTDPLTLSQIAFKPGGTSYGKNVHIGDNLDAYQEGDVPTYIGAGSTVGSSAGWLTQDPPKISTLVEPLTTAPGSNANWTFSGAVTQTDVGVGGGGYSGSGSELTSTDTFDLVGSEVIFEIVNTATSYVDIRLSSMIPEASQAALPWLVILSDSFGSASTEVGLEGMFATFPHVSGFIKVGLTAEGRLYANFSTDGASWGSEQSKFLDSSWVPYFRSNRISATLGDSGTIGSVNMLPNLSPTTSLSSPANNDNVSSTPSFTFVATDPEGNPVTYQLQIDTVNTFDSQGAS